MKWTIQSIMVCIFVLLVSPNGMGETYQDLPMTGQLYLVPYCLEYNMIAPVRVILLTEETDVSELGFTLLYDPTKLSIIQCLPGDLEPAGGWDLMTCEETSPGELVIYAYSATGSIPAYQSGDLFQLDFCCIWENIGSGDQTSIQVTGLSYDLMGFMTAGATLSYGGG
ncbi:MAG TPA: hypothetical protein PLV45_18690 [bacterium]|nr:hypothetical protein [bacterium]